MNATNKILSAEQVHTINAYPSISDSRLLAASHEALRSENRALRDALTERPIDLLVIMARSQVDPDDEFDEHYWIKVAGQMLHAAARALLGVTESGPPPT